MPRVSDLAIHNVRCFGTTQTARLARITLLVGDNSVGKSTFLACYNAFATLSNLVNLTDDNPFDVLPFAMGVFDTIARSRTSNFTIAGHYLDHIYSAAEFSFARGSEGGPVERDVTITIAGETASSATINVNTDDAEDVKEKRLRFQGPNFRLEMDWAEISFLPGSTWLSRNVRQGFLPYNGDRATFEKRRGRKVTSGDVAEFGKFVNFFRSQMPLPPGPVFNVLAFEPQVGPRTRTYEEPPPYLRTAEHITRTSNVGRTLGLWETIEVSEHGQEGPTEVSVTTTAGSHNLLDVGYGVHSLLPLVSAIEDTVSPSVFLLQQPEVHVHPVAQAKLAQYMAEGPHDYLIETHSDHVVDRFRLCVLEEVLRPEDLIILYFEKDEDAEESKIHSISVDRQGNILNAPDSYREFFLTETERLLGVS